MTCAARRADLYADSGGGGSAAAYNASYSYSYSARRRAASSDDDGGGGDGDGYSYSYPVDPPSGAPTATPAPSATPAPTEGDDVARDYGDVTYATAPCTTGANATRATGAVLMFATRNMYEEDDALAWGQVCRDGVAHTDLVAPRLRRHRHVPRGARRSRSCSRARSAASSGCVTCASST
jgi:hypothetical protein